MGQQLLLKFFQETLNRLFTKSPKFYKIWQLISSALLLISGVPYLLVQLGIVLPEPFATLASKAVTFAAAAALFMSMLSTQSKTVAVTNEGDLLKKTDEIKLPFTAQSEIKQANKEDGILNLNTNTTTETMVKVETPNI